MVVRLNRFGQGWALELARVEALDYELTFNFNFGCMFGFVVIVGAGDKWINPCLTGGVRYIWGTNAVFYLHLRPADGRVIHTWLWMKWEQFILFFSPSRPNFAIWVESKRYPHIWG